MTQDQAVKLRNFLHDLTENNGHRYYYFAVQQRNKPESPECWELCMYGGVERSSFLLDLVFIAEGLQKLICTMHYTRGIYDAGTTERDPRECICVY